MSNTTFSLRLKLLLGSLVILVAAQGFNGGLSLSSLEKLHTRSLVSSFEVVANDFLLKLQAAIRYGKSLEKFYGIDKAMALVKKDLPEIDNIVVAMPDGAIVQGMQPESVGRNLGQQLQVNLAQTVQEADGQDGPLTLTTPGQRHLLFLLRGPEGGLAGFVAFSFSSALIHEQVVPVLKQNSITLVYVTAGAALILALGLWLFVRMDGSFQKRRLYAVLLFSVVGAQLVYALVNISMFRDNYVDMTRTKTMKLATLVQQDIDFLLNKGVQVNRLRNIEKQFLEIIEATPELEYIQVLASDGKVLNRATRHGADALQGDETAPALMDDYYDITLPLQVQKDGAPEVVGAIHMRLSADIIQAKVRQILFDSLTITLISVLFVLELLILFLLYLRRAHLHALLHAADSRNTPDDDWNVGELVYMLARPAGFVLVFMWSLPASFIPLYMKTLYEPMFGLAQDVVLGLPISVEMFCSLVAALIAGAVTDRRGWHVPFLLGAVCCAGGAVLAATAQGGREFILARAVTGFGYGLSWMAIQGYVFKFSSPLTRARGIANLVAGIIAGQICGTAVGAMLADRIGYPPVFWASAILALLPLSFALFFMRPYMHVVRDQQEETKLRAADFFSLVFNRNYFSIIVFSLIPFSLCQVGLLFYAAPLYLSQLGVSQSNIGRVLMVYGLSVIFIAPWMSRFVDSYAKKKLFIAMGGIVGAVGLMSLYYYNGFPAVMVAVFLMGISGSLVGSAQTAFALKLKVIKRVGVGKAMSVQRAADKMGQMLGPLVLGAMIASVGTSTGVAIVGCIFFVATLAFFLVSNEARTTASEE